MKFLCTIIALCLSLGVFAQDLNLFEEGNALYNKGQYAEAIEKYKAVLNTDKHSAELYFNMANAHYKLNNIAPSIYYYEKALQLKPNDTEILNNRVFAQNMTIDSFVETQKVGFSRIFNNIITYLSFDAWATLAVVLVFLFVLFFLGYYFSYNTGRKRLAFVFSLLSLVLVLISLTLAFQRYNLDQGDKPAIVFAQESKLKSGANANSDEILRIHEGTKVQILESFEAWKKVELPNGTKGWIASEDIRPLN